MRVAVCAVALTGLLALGACAHHDHMASTGTSIPVAATEPAPPPPPAYTPPPPPEPAPPPPPPADTTARAGERG